MRTEKKESFFWGVFGCMCLGFSFSFSFLTKPGTERNRGKLMRYGLELGSCVYVGNGG